MRRGCEGSAGHIEGQRVGSGIEERDGEEVCKYVVIVGRLIRWRTQSRI